jgi:hypothetical protein
MPSLKRLLFAVGIDGLTGAALGYLASEYLPIFAERKETIFWAFTGGGLFIGFAHAIIYPRGRPIPY